MSKQVENRKKNNQPNNDSSFINRYSIFNYTILIGLAVTSQIHWCITHNNMEQLPVRLGTAIFTVMILIWPLQKMSQFLGKNFWGIDEIN